MKQNYIWGYAKKKLNTNRKHNRLNCPLISVHHSVIRNDGINLNVL
jgi:hypothetical protein